MAAPPTRDCIGDEVEKHCAREGEKAGVRKRGNEPRWKGSRRSCRAQRWDRHDMVAGGALVALRCGLDDFVSKLRVKIHVTVSHTV